MSLFSNKVNAFRICSAQENGTSFLVKDVKGRAMSANDGISL